jgi:hypothetical protein
MQKASHFCEAFVIPLGFKNKVNVTVIQIYKMQT